MILYIQTLKNVAYVSMSLFIINRPGSNELIKYLIIVIYFYFTFYFYYFERGNIAVEGINEEYFTIKGMKVRNVGIFSMEVIYWELCNVENNPRYSLRERNLSGID